jgi:hypothetical protein
MRRHTRSGLGSVVWPVALVLVGAIVASAGSAPPVKFFRDDPLGVEPETADASGAKPWTIDLVWDLGENLFANPGDPTPGVRARNINTIDEVPDSGWFTNRIGARTLTLAELARGPLVGDGPAGGAWTVSGQKRSGFAPGFTMKDGAGDTWFVSFDANGFPEAATGAIVVANKIFWALGYWQVENFLIDVRPDALAIGPEASFTPQSGKERRMRRSDLDEVFRRSHRSLNGTYRAVAGRAVRGKVLGGFRYHGTRPDDPNDLVPHEHRRELRALKVFGAWTNLVDMKAGNTLDAIVQVNGKGIVRHYLQDVGSTFGTGANGLREYDEGWEHLYQGRLIWKRFASLGFFLSPWQTVDYADVPAIGRFEGEVFDPLTWKPRAPTAAIRRAREDDTFWAARRVAAFSDEMIRAVAATGRYSDPAATAHLADVLIARRDKIVRAYLPAINPVVDFALSAEATLTFRNAAVDAGVGAPPRGGYTVHWFRFDNQAGHLTALGAAVAVTEPRAVAPVALPTSAGEYVLARITCVDDRTAWQRPVDVYFRRTTTAWELVGLERMPDAAERAGKS